MRVLAITAPVILCRARHERDGSFLIAQHCAMRCKVSEQDTQRQTEGEKRERESCEGTATDLPLNSRFTTEVQFHASNPTKVVTSSIMRCTQAPMHQTTFDKKPERLANTSVLRKNFSL